MPLTELKGKNGEVIKRRSLLDKYEDLEDEEIFIEQRLIVYLSYLKIAPNLRGYACMKTCVKRLVKDPLKKRNMTNGLYKELSEEYNIAINLIDRAMRHALLVSFKKEGVDDFEYRTGYAFASSHPTPREAVCLLAELVKMDLIAFRTRKNLENLA